MKRTFFIFLICISTFLSAETKIIAHRGFSAKAPENTLRAFKHAIRSGAEYLELDLHKSKDDSIMVIHDKYVDRTSSDGSRGAVAQMTYAELRKVCVGYSDKFGKKYKHAKIPTLKETLSATKGKIKVCIEIKVHDIEKDVMKIINDLNMNNEVIIFSFYYDVLEKIRELDANIPILYLKGKATEETLEQALAISAQAVGIGSRTMITKSYVDHVHKKGLELWQWTVNEPKDMERLLEMDIDGIITNYPDKALGLRKLKAKN